VAIYNGDDRRSIADNDDPCIDALSDAIGVASVCNRTLSAVLTKREGEPADYVVLPAHSFFDRQGKPVLNKEGKPCGEEEMARAEFFPNLKYLYLGADRGFAMRKVAVSWPPINLEAGREWGTMGEDVLIFRIDRPAEGYLSDDLMPSGRKRGYLRYFSDSAGSVDAGRSGGLTRIAFSKDSPRPLEQLVQTRGIVARFANSIVYDNSDTWVISSGSPLLGEFDGQTAILGHISTAAGDRNGKHEEPPPKIDKPTDKLELCDWNRNIPSATLARKAASTAGSARQKRRRTAQR
jgi:hypothetical protein